MVFNLNFFCLFFKNRLNGCHYNAEELMPIMYTPTVGKVCQRFSEVFNRPRGIYISSADRGNIYRILKNWPEKRVRLVVVTDGERVMGRGPVSLHPRTRIRSLDLQAA